MRGAREAARLLARGRAVATSPAAAGGNGGAVAAALAAPGAAAAAAQQECWAVQRWVQSCAAVPGVQQQQLQQRAQAWQQWVRRQPPTAPPARGLSSRPRGRRELYEGVAKRNSDQGWYILAAAIGMVGMTYAAVPLYRMFCQATGYGGTVVEGQAVEDKIRRREESPDPVVEAAAAARELTVYFNSDVADGMPWRFVPTQRSVKLHPGQSTLAFYAAENRCDRAVTGVSTYNVAPQQAGQYFNKIQCFCFEEQRLRPGERIDMPVFFYIDPEFATDPKMRGINTITLSYTFFKVAEEEWDEEGEASAAAAAAPLAISATAPQ